MEKADTMFELGRLSHEDYRARITGLRRRLKELEKQTTEADPLLLAKMAETERQISYAQALEEWATFKDRESATELKRRQALKDAVSQVPLDLPERERLAQLRDVLKQQPRGGPVFGEASQAMRLLQDKGSKGSFVVYDGLTFVPELDFHNTSETVANLLRKLQMFAYIYPDRVELKGVVRPTNVSAVYRSARCPRFRRTGAAGVPATL
jgi:hypothetical protein